MDSIELSFLYVIDMPSNQAQLNITYKIVNQVKFNISGGLEVYMLPIPVGRVECKRALTSVDEEFKWRSPSLIMQKWRKNFRCVFNDYWNQLYKKNYLRKLIYFEKLDGLLPNQT